MAALATHAATTVYRREVLSRQVLSINLQAPTVCVSVKRVKGSPCPPPWAGDKFGVWIVAWPEVRVFTIFRIARCIKQARCGPSVRAQRSPRSADRGQTVRVFTG